MYSPQRSSPLRKVYRDSPKRTQPDEKMSLEEFMESKRQKKRFKFSTPSPDEKQPVSIVRPPMKNNMCFQEPKIQVCVRKRPLNKREIQSNEKDVAPLKSACSIDILAPKQKVDLTNYIDQHSFTFDNVFDSTTSNRTIYNKTTYPLIVHMFNGGKATCFAYGQTGSGKTYTMLDSNHGLYFQAIHDIFRLLQSPSYDHLEAWMGYYEIYQGNLFDLLNNRKKLTPREDSKGNIVISGLKEHRIHSSSFMKQVFDLGNRARATSKTSTNSNSSRSHAILQILLKQKNQIYGKLNFIDLAGSERGSDRGRNPDTKTRMEGAEINKSLLALKECIRSLMVLDQHAPFRGSKLTMVLRDSFVGNSKTCMIATISPNHSNSDHTLNTLRYANRVKELEGESDPRLLHNIPQHQQEDDLHISIPQQEQELHVLKPMEEVSQINIPEQQQSKEEVPLISIPQPIEEAPQINIPEKKEKEAPHTNIPKQQDIIPPKLSLSHIKSFVKDHQTEIESCESYLRNATHLMHNFQSDFNNLAGNQLLLQKKYKQYQLDLMMESNQVDEHFQDITHKIKLELADEDEDDY